MKSVTNVILRGIGAVAFLCAAFGLYYNVSRFTSVFSGAVSEFESRPEMPYFHTAYYVMSAICVTCYVLLIAFAVQFLRGQASSVWWFTALMLFETVYFFIVGFLWLMPDIGRSVAAATGIANGGMMVQLMILFPLWAPPLVFWAHKRLRDSTRIA